MGKRLTVALATIAVVIALALVTYVVAYFWLGATFEQSGITFRVYSQSWMATLFRPATHVETCLRGRQVGVAFPEDWTGEPEAP